MSKTVKIPEDRNPFVVEVNNGKKYSYPAGTVQTVPDEVAAVIASYEASGKPANPPFIRKGMPDAGDDGDVLVAVDGSWAAQDGYGYTDGGEVSKIDEKYLPESGGGATAFRIFDEEDGDGHHYNLYNSEGAHPSVGDIKAIFNSGGYAYVYDDGNAGYLTPKGVWSLTADPSFGMISASTVYFDNSDYKVKASVVHWYAGMDDDECINGVLDTVELS